MFFDFNILQEITKCVTINNNREDVMSSIKELKKQGVKFNLKENNLILESVPCDFCDKFEIPDEVTIVGDKSFSNCNKIKSIKIPNSVTSIGNGAFSYCDEIKEILIPSSVKSLGKDTFYNCLKLQKVEIQDGLKNIDSYAFHNCSSLTQLNLPNSVESIGMMAFCGCKKLKEIKIPSNVVAIGKGCFAECENLEKIEVDEDNLVYDSRKKCNAIIETQENVLMAGCKSTRIPFNVTAIEGYAFYGCKKLEKINIPNNVKSLGYASFYNCSQLKEVTLPEKVNKIAPHSFSMCFALKNIFTANKNFKEDLGQFKDEFWFNFLTFKDDEKVYIPKITKIGEEKNKIKMEEIEKRIKQFSMERDGR